MHLRWQRKDTVVVLRVAFVGLATMILVEHVYVLIAALPFETQNSVSCSSLSVFTSLLFPPKISSLSNHKPRLFHCSLGETVVEPKAVATAETLLRNAVRGHDVERPPVWLIRQAGSEREFNPEESVPYVGEALTILQKEVLHSLRPQWQMDPGVDVVDMGEGRKRLGHDIAVQGNVGSKEFSTNSEENVAHFFEIH
ncbi:hypothetical protein V6N13_099965 [Hibiscus sabdariffa]|uniref:Uncharacterized protein n=1 Tax=Hibiscus sabdariffa TaxID=183260 RepID=A0ABR2NLE2_9ROSI